MTIDFKDQVRQAREQDSYETLFELIPYARLIGIECSRQDDELLFRLPAN